MIQDSIDRLKGKSLFCNCEDCKATRDVLAELTRLKEEHEAEIEAIKCRQGDSGNGTKSIS